MTVRDGKKKRGKDALHQAERGFYVYCIAAQDATANVFDDEVPSAIEPDSSLETVIHNELAAVVSSVPLSEYGEEALESSLSDATWTALRAMRHERVVEHFARRTSVVPLRFGTIYLERAGIEQMLGERGSDLIAIVERLRDKEEWGVNLYCDRAKLREKITSLSSLLLDMDKRADEATPGNAYLLRKKIEALRDSEARAEIGRAGTAIRQELAGHAEADVKLRVLKDEAAEHGDLVLKLALLVRRKQFDKFRRAAERLAEQYGDAGFRLELTGPWPAYNFATSV